MKRYNNSNDRDDHDYDKEAEELITGLLREQLYKLYQIALDEDQKYGNPKRHKELAAVIGAIERSPITDGGPLKRMKRGLSEMAQDAKATDGNTAKYRKKV